MEQKYINNLDLYEVDKGYYSSYEYRCKDRELMKLTPLNTKEKRIILWRDIETNLLLYGIEITNVMGMDAVRYFIFEMLNEELLGSEKTIKYINLEEEDYKAFLDLIASKQGSK